MKRIFASATLVAALTVATAGAASAEEDIGKVKTFDAAKHELTLKGKKKTDIVYYLPADFKDPGLKPGVRVAITWTMQDDKHMASNVVLKPKPAKPAKQK
ncbi:MAG: DUF1344 domain-containing protein [Bauldia sp.]|uniref:DUF1344 domain-containing protein n=1 Tax=Bauldia sp. TaxID=2575872 RepID=UPI001D8ADED9|nr:DUF1344 domain-containing protein [Bauldia sp.]MCB1494616.1 DUF1344 domain-containing protein [Bauldia sp.]